MCTPRNLPRLFLKNLCTIWKSIAKRQGLGFREQVKKRGLEFRIQNPESRIILLAKKQVFKFLV